MTDHLEEVIVASNVVAQWTWITDSNTESRQRAKSHVSREVSRRRKVLSQRFKDGNRKPPLLANTKIRKVIENPVSPLGAGRVDPFATYPFPTSLQNSNKGILELVDHFLYTAPSLQLRPQKRVCFLPLFQEIRRISFELAQNDPASFHTVLAIAAADKSILHNELESVQAITHNTNSIKILTKSLSDPESATSDATITAISLQIIFLLLFEDCDAVKAHQDALGNILRLRGGIETVETLNPQLTILINLADYLPPAVALLGRRRFYLLDEPFSNPARPSPVALVAPNGLAALSNFDMYFDISRICRSLQRATTSAFSGDFWTSSVTETHLRGQLQDLLALGLSNIAWGRRCEIMKCVCLSALIYLNVISQKGMNFVSASQELMLLLPNLGTKYKHDLENLIGELLFGDLGDCYESLAALMRIGAVLNQQDWKNIRQHLHMLYSETEGAFSYEVFHEAENESRQTEMAGLTALFGFFSVSG